MTTDSMLREPPTKASEAEQSTPTEVALRPATLIVNTKSRRGKEWYQPTVDCLKTQGVELQDAHELEDPSKLTDVIKSDLKAGAKLIIIGGGDGTFRTAAGLLAHTDATLGVLPLGTVNDFARNLGIEANVEAACKVIAEGHTALIDIGRANEEPFIITASLGFSAQSQLSLKPQLKKMCGPFGYLLASVLAYRSLRNLKITFRHDETEECIDALQAGVIKGHYWMGGKVEIPGVDLAVDKFAFYAIPARHRRSFLNMAMNVKHGRIFHMPDMRAFLTDDVTIETPTPQPLVLDGDLCGQTPVRLRVDCAALRVCAAPGFP